MALVATAPKPKVMYAVPVASPINSSRVAPRVRARVQALLLHSLHLLLEAKCCARGENASAAAKTRGMDAWLRGGVHNVTFVEVLTRWDERSRDAALQLCEHSVRVDTRL